MSTRPEPLTRRTFLAAAAAEASLSLGQTNEPDRPSRIIDTHTHFYDPTRPQGVPWPARSEPLLYQPTLPQDLRKVVQGLRVTGTVVVEASPWLEDNQWLLDLAKKDPVIVAVLGHLTPAKPSFH